MDNHTLGQGIILVLPALVVFLALVAHCYLYRGIRLTFAFFGGVFLHVLMKEITHMHVGHAYLVLIKPLRILHVPLIVYIGWAMTFYLSWYIAERILKRLGSSSDKVFPTIVWSMLVAGGIAYCVEATALNAGWWQWLWPDLRLKDFLVTPFAALEAWPSETAHFLLIFFLAECSRFRKEWWRFYLYVFLLWSLIIAVFVYFYSFLPRFVAVIRVYDCIRLLLPVFLMFYSGLKLRSTRIQGAVSKRREFFYDALPFFSLSAILAVCLITDTAILKQPELLISMLLIGMLVILSVRKIPFWAALAVAGLSLLTADPRFYIVFIPVIFYMFFGNCAACLRK